MKESPDLGDRSSWYCVLDAGDTFCDEFPGEESVKFV